MSVVWGKGRTRCLFVLCPQLKAIPIIPIMKHLMNTIHTLPTPSHTFSPPLNPLHPHSPHPPLATPHYYPLTQPSHPLPPPLSTLSPPLNPLHPPSPPLHPSLLLPQSPTIVVGDNRGAVTVYRVLEPVTITHEGTPLPSSHPTIKR